MRTGTGKPSYPGATRVLLVEPMSLLRGALAMVLAGETDLEVVAELNAYDDLVATPSLPLAHVTVLGLNPPTADGIAAVAWLADHVPGCALLLLTEVAGIARIRRTLNSATHSSTLTCAVRGIVGTDNSPDQLVGYIRRVASGEHVADPRLTFAPRARRNPLTTREREVLRLVATGMPDAEIARTLSLRAGTVRNYLSGILAKTSARNRVEAVYVAEELGWI